MILMTSTSSSNALLWTSVCLVALVLSVDGGAQQVQADNKFFTADLVELEGGRGPGSVVGPYQISYDHNGSQLLLWDRGGQGELRVLSGSFATLGTVELPATGFEVKGAQFGDATGHVIVWGRAASSANDTIIVFQPGDYATVPGYVPEGMVPLVSMDTVRFFDMNRILAVAGRDVNGTSRVVVIEMSTGLVMTNDTVDGNSTVVDIGNDCHSMTVLDDTGSVAVYQTTSWQMVRREKLFDGPFTSYNIDARRKWVFVSDDSFVAWRYSPDASWVRGTVDGGAITSAVYLSLPMHGRIVAAVPAAEGGSTLQLWRLDETLVYVMDEEVSTDVAVSVLIGDPSSNDVMTVGFVDGSLKRYQLTIDPVPKETDEFNIEFRYVITIIVVAIAIALYYRRRRGSGD